MTETPRRRGAAPDAGAVEALTAPRIAKAPDVDPVASAAGPRTRRRATAPAGPPGAKEQVKVWLDPADAGRLRGAFLRTRSETGYRSLSELITRAALREVRRLEKAHHGGQPFEPVAAGTLPTGRPVGS